MSTILGESCVYPPQATCVCSTSHVNLTSSKSSLVHPEQVRCVSQVTYKRLKDAVQSLGNLSQQGPASGLVDVLFGQRPPRFMAQLPAWTPINSGAMPIPARDCAISRDYTQSSARSIASAVKAVKVERFHFSCWHFAMKLFCPS